MPTLAIKTIKNRRNTSEAWVKCSNRFGITLKLERGTVFRRTPYLLLLPNRQSVSFKNYYSSLTLASPSENSLFSITTFLARSRRKRVLFEWNAGKSSF